MATNNENPLSRETFDGHRLGEIVVSDDGIDRVVRVDDNGGCMVERIMPRETFIEAYRKYILEE